MNHNKILYLQSQQLKHLYLKNKIEKMTHLNIIENMLTILLLTMYCYYKMQNKPCNTPIKHSTLMILTYCVNRDIDIWKIMPT